MKYLRQLRCKCHSAHKLPEVAPPKIEKRDFACLISNFRNVSLHTNPLQSFIVKYNKNETCGNLLLNKNLKGKACRTYDGEVIPFLKLPPQNSCVTSKAKGPLVGMSMFCTESEAEYTLLHYTIIIFCHRAEHIFYQIAPYCEYQLYSARLIDMPVCAV